MIDLRARRLRRGFWYIFDSAPALRRWEKRRVKHMSCLLYTSTAAVHWGFDSMLAHLLLTFQHRAGVSSYTSSFDLAQTCVFGKQLLGPILCGSISGAPLLPKLRGQFAEFLNNPSPVGLRIFFLPTCVGLRYGHRRNTHSFSRHLPSRTSVLTSLDRYRHQHPAPRLQLCPCV